ncbi:Cdc6/Cdc18 family protein [Halobiforma nitratireducens]|uniref:Cell division control protein cdc6-like protein n=1 Tax=Halobiforma nitratireducens JCM 10879 TaxID=1227454 RepID=M0M023_9EURY|nr:AAA family ATPase [Halobiforma nitratireducens]EMA39162.1 cell division control protein cdc6-like protein [Halobiforma nitratireducens JCM 10879]
MMASNRCALLNPETDPPAILHRTDERNVLHRALTDPTQHLYLHGPRGTGKTLLVRDALDACAPAFHYLSCIPHDTQYKVLAELYARITDTDLSPGYHTAQLQQRLAQALHDTRIIVLDDLAFLLVNDGSDLLYFLSRLHRQTDLHIIGISAVHPGLTAVLDERTYSTFRPHRIALSPYTEDQVYRILEQRVDAALPSKTVDTAALEYIAATTVNLTVALHWLACAVAQRDEITVGAVQAVEQDAVRRYRDARLTPFTRHHKMLLAVIEHLTVDTETVTTGTVYEQYTAHCTEQGDDPLTSRRISDYLTHLELLGLIDVTHHDGGRTGKTREIRPVPLQDL